MLTRTANGKEKARANSTRPAALGERKITRGKPQARRQKINIESDLYSCLEEQRRLDKETRTRRCSMHLDLPHTRKHSPLITPGHMSNNDCAQSSQGSLTTVESASSQFRQQFEQTRLSRRERTWRNNHTLRAGDTCYGAGG